MPYIFWDVLKFMILTKSLKKHMFFTIIDKFYSFWKQINILSFVNALLIINDIYIMNMYAYSFSGTISATVW